MHGTDNMISLFKHTLGVSTCCVMHTPSGLRAEMIFGHEEVHVLGKEVVCLCASDASRG
jgi:hypothetical protein